ncbi:MAG TPA: hypothetical protein VNY74_13620 [Edaphobacter sp.]|jgi:hypothetical protein|nr:hypothetical protein [Edaphobacter sp.]
MPHRRHTITVATSALFFVCLMLHAQTNLYSQTLLPYNNPEAYKVYEALASSEDLQAFFQPGGAGWEGLAERYPDSAHSYIVLSPVAFNADKTIAVVYMGHSCGSLCGGGTFYVLEKKDGIWKSMRWRGTSCAWAS